MIVYNILSHSADLARHYSDNNAVRGGIDILIALQNIPDNKKYINTKH